MDKKYDENSLKTIETLKEVFSHYSKQNVNVKIDYTFEDIKEDHGLLNLTKVLAFLHDFSISFNPQVLKPIFLFYLEND